MNMLLIDLIQNSFRGKNIISEGAYLRRLETAQE